MPLCICYTNLESAKVPAEFEQELTKCVSGVLSKPEARITVVLHTGARMCRAGSLDPALLLQIRSIKVFDTDKNTKYWEPIFTFLKQSLKDIDESRMTVEFVDISGDFVKNGPIQ